MTKKLCDISIEKLVIKVIRELTDEDGRNDGFKDKEELVSVIKGIYGKVEETDLVSIYCFTKYELQNFHFS